MNVFAPVKALAVSRYATVPPAPNATEEESVPVKVRVLLAVRVFPSAIVKVALAAGSVITTLLTDVADATPRVGVVRLGLVANTRDPEPVSSEIMPANCDEVVDANCAKVPPVVAIVPA